MISFSFLHAFHTFRPRFWVFEIFLGFFKIDELFVKLFCWVLIKWSYMLMHCITFAFSQYFMHFRCVFYMLEPCVLVGLDWAEPLMLFLLHVTWSCIFHAYVPFFSFFLVFLLIGSFLPLSLSLSLSLSRIVYAWHPSLNPLRPRTLSSQNPFCSGASSFSDSTPLHIRSCDEKAHQDFSENFFKRGIHSKCHVILLDFSDTDLPTVINSRGS